MRIKSLNPHITFDGTAEQAIRLYEHALGAKIETKMLLGDVPGTTAPPGQERRVMHATLRVGEGVIMLSDAQTGDSASVHGNIQIALHFAELTEMAQAFDALTEGGQVTVPLQDTFWNARFGMLTDAFGIRWMFNCEMNKA
jgi:PhnB protein